MNRRDITLADLPVLKGRGQGFVGFAVFRKDHQSRGFPVYAVNGVKLFHFQKFLGQPVQPVPGEIPAIGADGNAGTLIQGGNVFIFVDYRKIWLLHSVELWVEFSTRPGFK